MIDISEIFYSIQGESTYSGLPFIFVRFARCNLRCKYCDAKYSYTVERSLTVEQIMKFIKTFLPIKNILITGGEPLLQAELYNLIDQLRRNDYKILLETNGSLPLEKISDYVIKIVDVKCPDSGVENSFLMKNLDFIDLRKDQIKFVISSDKDYIWARDFILKNNLQSENVLLSAAWNLYSYRKLAEHILADRLTVRFQPQIHKFIWPNIEKGV